MSGVAAAAIAKSLPHRIRLAPVALTVALVVGAGAAITRPLDEVAAARAAAGAAIRTARTASEARLQARAGRIGRLLGDGRSLLREPAPGSFPAYMKKVKRLLSWLLALSWFST